MQVEPLNELAMVLYYCTGLCDESGPYTTALFYPGGNTGNPADRAPSWSPDGQLAFERDGEIMVLDIPRGSAARNLTNHPARDTLPAWSPDGSKIAFVSDREGQENLYVVDAAGHSLPLRIRSGPTGRPSWSADGTKLALTCVIDTGNSDICVINADGSGLKRLTDHPATDAGPAWSPDGSKIVFSTSRYSSEPELALMNADGSGVSRMGIAAYDPAWSSDGSHLAFVLWEPCYFFWGCPYIYVANADGSAATQFAYGFDPAWRPSGALPPPAQPPTPPPPPNQPPVLASVANQSHRVGQSVSLALSASDADGDTLYYSVSGLPPGLVNNTASGVISGTPTKAGSDDVRVEVFDGRGGIALTTFTWSIAPPPNQAPVLAPVANQSTQLRSPVSLALSASDADGDRLSYAASGLPRGLRIDAASGVISGTPSARGSFRVTARVSDGRGASANRSFNWTITR